MGIHKGFLFYGHLNPLFLNSISTDVYMLQLLLDGATLKSSNSSPFPFLFLAVIVEFQSLKGALHFPILFIFQSPRCFCSFPNRLAGNPFLSPFNPVPTAQAPQQPPAPPTAAAAVNPFGLPPPHSQTPGAQPSFRPSSVFLGGFGGGNASAGFPFPAPFGAPGAVPRHARKRCRRTREGFRATETARPSPVLGAAPQGCGPAL